MLPDHAARIRPAEPASARKHGVQAVEAQGQLVLREDGFAHGIGQRHFSGGDEPEPLSGQALLFKRGFKLYPIHEVRRT